MNQPSDIPPLEIVIDYTPVTIAPDANAIDAIALMHRAQCRHQWESSATGARSSQQHRSSYVLAIADSRPIGILTQPDVVRLIATGVDLAKVRVMEVMTQPVITLCRADARDVVAVLSLLRQHGIRQMPIVDDRGLLVGMVSEQDLLEWFDLLTGATARPQPQTDRHHLQIDRHLHELELLRECERLEAFFSQSPDGFFLMMLDRPIQWDDSVDKEALLDYVFSHQSITKVNAAMLAQYDAVEAEFVGLTPNDFFAHDLATGRQTWREMFDKGRLQVETYERKLDGTQMWIEGDYSCVYNSDGNVIGHFGIQRDITDRKQAAAELQQLHDRLQEQAAAYTTALLDANRQLHQTLSQHRRTEATLRQSQQDLSDFVENAIVGLHWVAADGTIIWANQAELDLLGYTRDEYIGHSITEFHVDRVTIEDLLDRLLSDRSVREYEADLRCKDGSIRHVLIDSNSSWRDGEFLRTRCFTRDITERKRAEEDLERFNQALSHAMEGIALLDLQGHYLQINQAYASALGYSPEAIVGMDWRQTVHPEDLAKMQIAYEYMLEHGKVEVAARGVRGDGSIFYKQLVMVKAFGDRQQPIGHYCFMKDVSAAKQAEADLIHSEQKFRAVFDSMFQFIGMLTPEGIVIEANRTALEAIAADRADIIGRPFWETPWWTHSPQLQEQLQQAIVRAANGELVRFEADHIWANGTTACVDFSLKPVFDEAGKVVMLIPEGRDITDRKQAELALQHQKQELAHSNEELQQFAYAASHDLQEPLRTIASYLELIQHRYQGQLDAKADTFIAYAVDGATRMQKLINDLLRYSWVGTQEQRFYTTDCHKIVQNVSIDLQAAIDQSNAVITADPLPEVNVDPVQLTQLFQNLISNAIKFRSQELPQIHVSVRDDDGKWLFSVRDNGIGMEPQYLERIFIIFQRLHGRAQYPGTGIGLAICKKIVERHGGTLWVESQPGRGSTFYFTLPFLAN
jgi:PAS domain S-box-containing protein